MEHRGNEKNAPESDHSSTIHWGTGRVTAALLLIMASLALLFGNACNQPAAPASTAAGGNTKRVANQSTAVGHKFVAYYFHRTLRCPTCLSIEKQSKDKCETRFSDALRDGHLVWQAVNIESPGNSHFEQEFQLEAQALILVEMQDGKMLRWKNLPKIWDLVDKPGEFQEYVRSELTEFMAG